MKTKEGEIKMDIGITYDLKEDYLAQGYDKEQVAELDSIDTIEAIENALQCIGFETQRIGNIKNLINKLAQGKRWDAVFNIAEGLYGMGREAQIPAILDAYQIPYVFSDPLVLAVCLHKRITKEIVRNAGIPTPDFAEVHVEADIENVCSQFPLFVKPVAEGTSKGITESSIVTDKDSLRELCSKLLKQFNQPVLIERYLPGREFTVGIVGTGQYAKAIGTMEIVLKKDGQKGAYSYANKQNWLEWVEYRIADELICTDCIDIALKAWQALGCRDAGRIDLRLDEDGAPNFLEVNPLAGLNPDYSDLPIMCNLVGIDYAELIAMIMESVLTRISADANGNINEFLHTVKNLNVKGR